MHKTFSKKRLAVILTLGALVVAAFWSLGSVSGDASPRRVLIEKGASAKKIASELRAKGLIRSRLAFVLLCRVNGTSGKLKPGLYEFNRSMTPVQMMRSLEEGDSIETWVTFPEGYTIRQMADLLDDKGLHKREDFIDAALDRGPGFNRYAFLYGDSLEGYLFPDTYLIARDADTDGAIVKMLDAFESKVVSPMRPRLFQAISERFGQVPFPEGLHRILTMASLVEREAKTQKDRALVAGVLWNRLKRGMKLQVDATVSYIPGESTRNPGRVYHSDLANGSSYNTYKHLGLPPGPICNPGIAAIEAVIDPTDTDYLYYVAKRDGSHIFSRTYEQHRAAIRAARRDAETDGRIRR